MYYSDNEEYLSDLELDTEKDISQIENENEFDKYMDEVKDTYDNLIDYVNNFSKNINLLQNLPDYTYLDTLFIDEEFEFSELFKNKIKFLKKDDIFFDESIDITKTCKKDIDDKWITLKPKDLKRREKNREKREQIRILKEKRKREKMTKRTTAILKRYNLIK